MNIRWLVVTLNMNGKRIDLPENKYTLMGQSQSQSPHSPYECKIQHYDQTR